MRGRGLALLGGLGQRLVCSDNGAALTCNAILRWPQERRGERRNLSGFDRHSGFAKLLQADS